MDTESMKMSLEEKIECIASKQSILAAILKFFHFYAKRFRVTDRVTLNLLMFGLQTFGVFVYSCSVEPFTVGPGDFQH